jgi:hypothetical protein
VFNSNPHQDPLPESIIFEVSSIWPQMLRELALGDLDMVAIFVFQILGSISYISLLDLISAICVHSLYLSFDQYFSFSNLLCIGVVFVHPLCIGTIVRNIPIDLLLWSFGGD